MVTMLNVGNEFAKHLQDSLRAKGLSNAQLAKATGYSKAHIGRLVSGKQLPSAQIVRDIAPHLDIPAEKLQALADASRLGQERLERAAGVTAEASNSIGVWLPVKNVLVDGIPIAESFRQVGFAPDLLQKLHVRNDLVARLLLGLPLSHECFMVLEPDGSRRYLSPGDVALIAGVPNGAPQEPAPGAKKKGASRKPADAQSDANRSTGSLPPLVIPDDVTDPPDDWELQVIDKIGAYDWGDLDPRRMGEFWYMDKVSRRRVLRHLEDIWLDFGRDRQGGPKGDATAAP